MCSRGLPTITLTGSRAFLQSDILLMGGDLYHDHKPSRQCMVKSLKMFRRYVFGDR